MKSLISCNEIPPDDALNWSGTLPPQTQNILWVVAISLAIMAPALVFGIPSNRDLTNHFRFATPFYEALSAGHLYSGWLAESNGGYGDASFRFYPPGLYYLLGLMRMLTGDWYAATLISFSLLSIISGLGIYLWARITLTETAALWAAIFHALAPYHINQFYQALLLAEYAAAAVLPFAFAFTERICRRRRMSDVAGLALAYAALVLTHLPLTVIGSLALLVYAFFRVRKEGRWAIFGNLFLAAALGLAASACYWTTMVAERDWIRADNIQPDPSVDYRKNFIFSTFSPDNLNVWWMNILTILTFLMLAPAIVLIGRRAKADVRNLRPVLALFAASVLMAIPISLPVWTLLSPLQQTQFPWRWLVIVSMAASLIGGSAITLWTKSNYNRSVRLIVFGAVVIAITFSLSHTVREAIFLSQPQFDAMLQSVRGSDSVYQWLPVWTNGTPKRMVSEVEAHDRTVTIHDWQPLTRSFYVASGDRTEARIRTYYYPHWFATTNGKALQTKPAEDGALLVDLPGEPALVSLDFREPRVSRISSIISLFGWIGIAGLAGIGWIRAPCQSPTPVQHNPKWHRETLDNLHNLMLSSPHCLLKKVLSVMRSSRQSRAMLSLIIVGTAAIVPILLWGIPAGADLNNHYRFALPFYEAVQAGNIYPSWLAESNAGFGDARFRFYPPGLYYLLAIARLVTGWYSATILTFVVLSVLGGLGLYFWTRSFSSVRIAMVAGMFYMLSPYRLNELYQASLLSEYAACSVWPFAFAFLERVCRKGKPRDMAGLAGCYALAILLHLPLTVIGSLSLVVYAIVRINRARFLRTFTRVSLALALGLAASAFFWTTVLAELSWIKGHSVNPKDYYDYSLNFLFSPWALTNRNTWYANVLGLALIGFFLPGLLVLGKIRSRKRLHSSLVASVGILLFSFLMTTEISRPIWAIIPKLPEVQFPWRWLAITSMCGSILLAASMPRWVQLVKHRFRPLYLVFGLGFLLSLFFTATQIVWDSDYLKRQQFDSLLVDIRGSVSFKDWLPIWAHDVVGLQKMENEVEANSRQITITSWEPEHRSFQVSSGPATEARVRTYFYPLWKATMNGTPLSTRPAADGTLLISIPAESANIELEFREPPRFVVALIVSLVIWIVLAVVFAFRPCAAIFKKLWQTPVAGN